MLELSDKLPGGALVDGARAGLEAALQGIPAFWWQARREAFELEGEVVQGWTDALQGQRAAPTKPNDGGARLTESSAPGLHTEAETHCGLVAERITENAGRFSFAVIYTPRPGATPKTLLTLNGAHQTGAAEYFFLSDGGDTYTVKDTSGAVELLAPVTAAPDAPRMAVVTLAGDRLAFAEDLNPPVVAEGRKPALGEAADLFFGVRSHRAGLKKTLGAAHIHEVLFFPRHCLLLPRSPEDEALLTALRRYRLWEY